MIFFYFFSFKCGGDYHAPTDCETIKRWLTKCADDSETANYISAHTKDVSSYSLPPLFDDFFARDCINCASENFLNFFFPVEMLHLNE